MQQSTFDPTALSAAATGRRLAGLWRTIRASMLALDRTLAAWHFRAKSRRDLARLDERLLRDMGLDPLAARREMNKPFWRR